MHCHGLHQRCLIASRNIFDGIDGHHLECRSSHHWEGHQEFRGDGSRLEHEHFPLPNGQCPVRHYQFLPKKSGKNDHQE